MTINPEAGAERYVILEPQRVRDPVRLSVEIRRVVTNAPERPRVERVCAYDRQTGSAVSFDPKAYPHIDLTGIPHIPWEEFYKGLDPFAED